MPELHAIVRKSLPDTRTAIEAALKTEGFGVLTEVDVQAIFKAKLGAEHEGHRILGVCNPSIAKRALDLDRDIALLLPCTVTLREVDGGTEVKVLDPQQAFTLTAPATRAQLEPLAGEVGTMLARALAAVRAEQGVIDTNHAVDHTIDVEAYPVTGDDVPAPLTEDAAGGG